VEKLPNHVSLYLEKIDVGDPELWTVVSGLAVNHIPIEETKDRLILLFCNDAPVQLEGGVMSSGEVLCAWG